MLKIKKFTYAYCDRCEKEVRPKRKAMDGMYINVWILILISSLGFGIIPFLIYRYIYLKKNLCPSCNSQVDFYDSPEEIPEPKSQIIRILKSIEDEKKLGEFKEADLIFFTDEHIPKFCDLCGEKLNYAERACQNCGSKTN